MSDPKEADEEQSLSLEKADEEAAWERFAAEQFLQGYAESDAIYDEVYGDLAKRARHADDDEIEEHP